MASELATTSSSGISNASENRSASSRAGGIGFGTRSSHSLGSPIDQRFTWLREQRRTALVTYVTAGHPDRERSLAVLQGIANAGADIIEIGVPFSDPLADGPVIQSSSQQALEQGMTLDRVLALVSDAALPVPVVLFSYLNPILAAGQDALARVREAGCSGILVTDLPVGADPEREAWISESGLAFIRLVAPTTPVDRMREVAAHGSGFVYLISRLGVTGMRDTIATNLPAVVARVREATTLPVCVGFGISTPAHARQVADLADGVVVGSALVRAAEESVDSAIALTRALRSALDDHAAASSRV